MSNIVAQWHSDAGHEWLKVWQSDCEKLGLVEADFSRSSYKRERGAILRDSIFFLEGDCDAGFFIEAAKRKGFEVHFVLEAHCNGESPIRKLPRLKGESRLWAALMAERQKAKQAVMSPSYDKLPEADYYAAYAKPQEPEFKTMLDYDLARD